MEEDAGTRGVGRGRRPILVTGVPRSGTTWVARLLATAPGTALAGREPMNPRRRQYALAGTLTRWTRLEQLSLRQQRSLKIAYRGFSPLAYSRYGRRRWAGPFPWIRMVVKDPFAMLSLPAVVETTAAVPVLVFRHPGAVLASYRRMGWAPDVGELVTAAAEDGLAATDSIEALRAIHTSGGASRVEAMGWFWNALHEVALGDLELYGPDAYVVSHEELAGAGMEAARRLLDSLGLRWTDSTARELSKQADPTMPSLKQLHNFDRSPAEVATEWQSKLGPGELETIEEITAPVRKELDTRRLSLTKPDDQPTAL